MWFLLAGVLDGPDTFPAATSLLLLVILMSKNQETLKSDEIKENKMKDERTREGGREREKERERVFR